LKLGARVRIVTS